MKALGSLLMVLVTAALAAAAPFYLTLEGRFVDTFLSRLFSSRVGIPLQLIDVRVSRFSDVYFGFLMIDSPDHRTLLASGAGRARVDGWAVADGRNLSTRVVLSHVAIMEDLYKKTPVTRWISNHLLTDPLYVQRAEIFLSLKGPQRTAHFLNWTSDDIRVFGGFTFVGKEFWAANLVILIPHDKFEGLPKELRSRMIQKSGGWRGVRVTYRNGSLTVSGRTGPFFKAHWGV